MSGKMIRKLLQRKTQVHRRYGDLTVYVTLPDDQNPLISDWEHLRHNWTDAAENDNGTCFRNGVLFLEWQSVYQIQKSRYFPEFDSFAIFSWVPQDLICSAFSQYFCEGIGTLDCSSCSGTFVSLKGIYYCSASCSLTVTSQFHWHKIFTVPQIGRETLSTCVILSLCIQQNENV